MRRITILGSTGSIGTQTLDVARAHPDMFKVAALAAANNYEVLARQAREFGAEAVAIANAAHYEPLKELLADTPTEVLAGEGAVAELARLECADLAVAAMVGFCGLEPTLAAIESGKDVALANKETLVVAGETVMRLAAQKRSAILPVDSEHSAIFQCLQGESESAVEKILLTASGGPFRGMDRRQLENVTPEQALRHPNWNMGAKVTIDSASMMNKGLESIEARWLFDLMPEQIEILVHPQSVVHSMVQFADGSVKAQLAVPDMRLPIQYALTWPQRLACQCAKLDFAQTAALTFERADSETFRNLGLAFEAMRRGGTAPCAMNAANEVAVQAFLERRISFMGMSDVIEKVIDKCGFTPQPTLDDYRRADAEARELASDFIAAGTYN